METHDATKLTRILLDKHNLRTWRVRLSSMKASLGMCSHRKKEITLSSLYVTTSDQNSVEQTILHEIAHALIGPIVKSHGLEWKQMARSIGVHNPKATVKINAEHRQMINSTRRGPNYAIDCPNCGRIDTAQRMGRRMRHGSYRCTKCRTGGLLWKAI